MSLFTFAEVRAIVADRPPGPEGTETLDELLDLIAADFADQWPNAPEAVGFNFAVTQLSMALRLGAPGDDDEGGGRGRPRRPAPVTSPETIPA